MWPTLSPPYTPRVQQALDRLKATLAAERAWAEAQRAFPPDTHQLPALNSALPPDEWSLWPVRVARRCLEDGAYFQAMQKLVNTPILLPVPVASQGRTQDAGFNPSEPRDKAGKWMSGGGGGGTAHTSRPKFITSHEPSLPPNFVQVLASNPKLRAEFQQARALHARMTPHDIALVNAWRSLHEPQPSLQQAAQKETGNAYWEGNSPARITYADTDTARDPVWRSTLLSTPETSAHQARLVNAGAVGSLMVKGLARHNWAQDVAALKKSGAWKELLKLWEEARQALYGHPPKAKPSHVHLNTEAKAPASKEGAGSGAKKGEKSEAQGQGKGEGQKPPPEPEEEKPKPKTEKVEPPWEEWRGEDGRIKGSKNDTRTCWNFPPTSNPEREASKFFDKLVDWLESKGIILEDINYVAKNGGYYIYRFSKKITLILRNGRQSGSQTDINSWTLDVGRCEEIYKIFGNKFKKFKFNLLPESELRK